MSLNHAFMLWLLGVAIPACNGNLSHTQQGRTEQLQQALSTLEFWVDRTDQALKEVHISGHLYTGWSPCTASCGIGFKFRTKIGNDDLSAPGAIQTLYCNAHPCPEMAKPKRKRYANCVVRPDGDPTPAGGVRGIVTLTQEEHGAVIVHVELEGFTPATPTKEHGFHVHEYGDLSGGCATAGGHYNPKNATHGGRMDSVRHVGDLGNIRQNQNGFVNEDIIDERISLFGDKSIVGRAIVVHANRDDLGEGGDAESSVTGNAGPRLACCIIGIVREE